MAMARITLYKDHRLDTTPISNLFIDEYMKDANDAQLKVYLYLVRMLNANLATSVSEMADLFNHTEKDVNRALKYWAQKGLLELNYDSADKLVSIQLLEINTPSASQRISMDAPKLDEPPKTVLMQNITLPNARHSSQIVFIAESYLGRPLNVTEMQSLYYYMDELHFSFDLTDYLLQYCVDHGKKDFRYINKVAHNWADKGVTTSDDAKALSRRDKNFYTVYNALGKGNNQPTAIEEEYICSWINDSGFSMDVILKACEKAVLYGDKSRIKYANSLIEKWKAENIKNIQDIQNSDNAFKIKCANSHTGKPKLASSSKFHHFAQNNYDFDALEQQLLSN